ncbi:MAG: putative membrane protein [Halioglobus sp.]
MRELTWSTASDKMRVLCLLSWVLLLAVQVIDSWVTQVPWIIVLGKILPLLIFLPGVIGDNLRSYIWMCFVSLLYFLVLVERLFAQPDSILAMLGMVAVVTLFTSAMLYVRWRAHELKES